MAAVWGGKARREKLRGREEWKEARRVGSVDSRHLQQENGWDVADSVRGNDQIGEENTFVRGGGGMRSEVFSIPSGEKL